MAMLTIEPGQRFREAGAGLFGRPGPTWIVREVFIGTDGFRHARIELASDSARRKTISVSVLEDRRRFIQV